MVMKQLMNDAATESSSQSTKKEFRGLPVQGTAQRNSSREGNSREKEAYTMYWSNIEILSENDLESRKRSSQSTTEAFSDSVQWTNEKTGMESKLSPN